METVDEHENSKKEKENELNEQGLMCMRQDEIGRASCRERV